MKDLSAKNFSTSCVAGDKTAITMDVDRQVIGSQGGLLPFCLLCLLLGLLFAVPTSAKKPLDPEELFNPLLGVDYSHWLIGPIVHMATEEEVDSYLRLTSDEEAEAFIERFWEKRNEGTDLFAKSTQQIFEARSGEADKRFTERTYPGHRTDRGTIWILYGEPEEIEFESPRKVGYPTLEVWRYAKDAEAGLDGERPKKLYRFYQDGDRTIFFTGRYRPDARDRVRQRRF